MTSPGSGERGTRPSPAAARGSQRRLRAVETAKARPTLRPPECPPNNLPLELSSFIGRERELSEVEELLAGKAHLLTLTGPGGCGKTRLALKVAADVIEGFEDGAWLVELASLSDPEFVPQAVSSVLDVREQPGHPLIDTLSGYLRSKKLLLVLDNCEHLVEACAGLAGALLRECGDLHILATSREPLGITGEIAWPVPPLSLPAAHHLPPAEEVTQYEAVSLFVERAAAALPGFALTDRNAAAATEVCRKVDGLPLAIELAAARVRMLGIEQIAERLGHCFGLLPAGSRTALPRQRTLRATIDWSYDLLSPNERVLFKRLSVFAGGFALEATEEVCSGEGIEKDEVLDLLSHLVDKSLVLVSEEDGGEARYRFLETVRQYSSEKLEESGEAVTIKLRHADLFLELAEEAERGMLGPEQWAWLERLEREHDNLRAALGWFRDQGKVERGLRLGGALGRFWWYRGYFTEGRAWLEELLELARAAPVEPAVRAKGVYALGVLLYQIADQSAEEREVARFRLEESIGIYREQGDGPHVAAVLRDLGRLGTYAGDWEKARSFLMESLELERRLGNEHGIALARFFLGILSLLRGEHGAARAHLEESLGVLREAGGTEEVKTCLWSLGLLACDQGDYATARTRFAQMMEGAPLRMYTYATPWVLQAYARLAVGEGRAARALRLAGAAEALHLSTGSYKAGLAHQTYFRRGLEPAWQALGEHEGKAAFEEGRTMAMEEAIAYALDETATLYGEVPYPPPTTEIAPPRPKDQPKLSILALGPVRVKRGEETLASSGWTYNKARELLFYLLSYPSATKAQIGLDLWPEASPSQLRRTFHTALHYLRQALGGAQWIVFEKGRYSFDRSLPYFYDVEAFESGVAQAKRLQGESPERSIVLLKEAVELYGGDFLEDSLEGEWALVRQGELRRTCQEALLSLGELLVTQESYGEAAQVYRRAIEHDPYLEVAHRELMLCYVRMGERGQALRHYQTLVELLREDLGSSPAPETTELYERLRQS